MQEIPVAANVLLSEISKWRKDTRNYRVINIILFIACKFGVPAISAIMAASLSVNVAGGKMFDQQIEIWMSIVVTFFSALDTFIDPKEKKKLALETNNALALIQERLLIKIESNPAPNILAAEIERAADEKKQILDNYARRGW